MGSMTNSEDVKAQFTKALAELERGDLYRARNRFSDLLKDRPEAGDVQFQIARLERLAGNPEIALQNLEPLLAAHPKELTLWLERALLARSLGHPLKQAPSPDLIDISRGKAPQLPQPGGK